MHFLCQQRVSTTTASATTSANAATTSSNEETTMSSGLGITGEHKYLTLSTEIVFSDSLSHIDRQQLFVLFRILFAIMTAVTIGSVIIIVILCRFIKKKNERFILRKHFPPSASQLDMALTMQNIQPTYTNGAADDSYYEIPMSRFDDSDEEVIYEVYESSSRSNNNEIYV